MLSAPKPIFETYEAFIDQDFSFSEPALNCVKDFLDSFPEELEAGRGYMAVRTFLRAFSDNAQTFSSYRTQAERLFLWTLLVKKKPLHLLKRQDAQDYLDFCRKPSQDWVGPVTRSRFVPNDEGHVTEADALIPNPKWFPFNSKTAKAVETTSELSSTSPVYTTTESSLKQVFTVCSRFYEFLIEDGGAAANPFRMLKKSKRFTDDTFDVTSGRALTPLQWDYVLETAEKLAEDDPVRFERTLFILATLFAMYLRVSDVVGRKNWKPTMGDFRQDAEGFWWYHAVGKGNKAGKIAVRDEYIESYLKRYRKFLGLSDLPERNESTPLISTLRGRSGLSDRQVRALLQIVFDKALERMRGEGREKHEMDSLLVASAHWLRHTSATFDAPLRDAKDLQVDLRHSNLSTTQDTYYHSHDQARGYSVKRIGMRDRG
jgi:site-specific recombinase XerD